MRLPLDTCFTECGSRRRAEFDTLHGASLHHITKGLKVDMSHATVEFVERYGGTNNVCIEFRTIGGAYRGRVETVEVVYARDASQVRTIRSGTIDYTLTVFYSQRASRFVEGSDGNESEGHFRRVEDSFQRYRRSIHPILARKGNNKIASSNGRKGMSIRCSD